MHDAVATMLARYVCKTPNDYLRALREILQEIALLGLWRSKFFEVAAFYGGTALRVLHGLDRFSEDLDFSLLEPSKTFELEKYGDALQKELAAFGFDVQVIQRNKAVETPIQSAFLKANTVNELLVITSEQSIVGAIPAGQTLKIKLEVDTDPPPGFSTQTRFLLQPIPFSVRAYVLPDLFAGKMHALLCRKWKNRVKGRDWYDFVWYVAHQPVLNLSHLEQRMRQSGHWRGPELLTPDSFDSLLAAKIDELDVGQAIREVEPFVADPRVLEIWSREFFHDIRRRISFAAAP